MRTPVARAKIRLTIINTITILLVNGTFGLVSAINFAKAVLYLYISGTSAETKSATALRIYDFENTPFLENK